MVCGGAVDIYSVKGLTGWGTPFGVGAGSRLHNFRPPKPFPDIKAKSTSYIVDRSVVSLVRQYRLLGELHGFQAIFGVFRVESG